jgi:hypothetical protein
MPSPPKPWEVNSGTAVAATPVISSQQSNNMTDTVTTTTSAVPTVPNRPSTMGTGMGMNSMGTMGLGSSYGGKVLYYDGLNISKERS